MSAFREKTITLPAEEMRYIDDLVADGDYGSASDVVQAGLTALRERDAALETWLQDDVVPVARRMMAEPETSIPAKSVFESLRQRVAKAAGTREGL